VGGRVGTVSEASDVIGQYQDAGIDLLINADQRNDEETRELLMSCLALPDKRFVGTPAGRRCRDAGSKACASV
jgi:hypothetical protein